MVKSISLAEAERTIGVLLDRVGADNEPVVVEDNGRRVAVVVPPEDFDELDRIRAWNAVRGIQDRNADNDPDEVMRLVTEVVEEVRQEMYEARRRADGGR